MKQSPPAHKSGTAGQIVNPIPHNIHVDAGPLTAQIADYYDRRQHANTTQRGKLAAQLEREAVAEKAPKDVQATLVAPSAEQRLQGLIKALLEYMPQIGEVQDENGDYVDACLRKIISENA